MHFENTKRRRQRCRKWIVKEKENCCLCVIQRKRISSQQAEVAKAAAVEEIKIFKSRSKYFESRSAQEIFSLQSQKLLCVIAFQMFVKMFAPCLFSSVRDITSLSFFNLPLIPYKYHHIFVCVYIFFDTYTHTQILNFSAVTIWTSIYSFSVKQNGITTTKTMMIWISQCKQVAFLCRKHNKQSVTVSWAEKFIHEVSLFSLLSFLLITSRSKNGKIHIRWDFQKYSNKSISTFCFFFFVRRKENFQGYFNQS